MTVAELFQRALMLHQQGQLVEAEAAYRELLGHESSHADAMQLLGVLRHQLGASEEGLRWIDEALKLRPGAAVYHSNRGEVLRKLSRHNEALEAFEKALAIDARLAQAVFNLAITLEDLRRLHEAREKYLASVQMRPAHVAAWVGLSRASLHLDLWDEAASAARRALALDAASADAHVALGSSLAVAEPVAAEEQFLRALELAPDRADAYSGLATALREQGRTEEGVAALERAAALEPENVSVRDQFLFAVNESAVWPAERVAEQHRRWGDDFADGTARPKPFENVRDAKRRLRVGYVSPDFREHAVARFFEPVLRAHDRNQVEVFCYSNVRRADGFTERIQQLANQWRDISSIEDDVAAALVRADRIDVLVDLAGHTRGNRLGIFARRAAPVQVTYLGYPNTTGIREMDLRLTDALADPEGITETLHTEKLVRLSGGFLCYGGASEQPRPLLNVTGEETITFASFNRPAKITEPVIALWARILRELPQSRLMLKGFTNEAATRARRAERFAAYGIDPSRIGFGQMERSHASYLASYNAVDIALDPFPYNGTTTTCEALWMGVPVVTLEGGTHVSRVGVSILTNVGLPELVARDEDDYVSLAVELARNAERRLELRRTLRDLMRTSPLMDEARVAREIETAYRARWIEWCNCA